MGGILLFEGEELFVRFRPHPVAYGRRYASAFLWAIPACVAAAWPTWVGGARATEWGLAVFIALAMVGAFVSWKLTRASAAFSWFAILCAAGLIFASIMGWLPVVEPDWLLAATLGAVLILARLIVHEADRVGRQHFLTTERLVIRGGLRSRRERTLPLKKIQEVRTERPLFGQFFDFGDVFLVQARTMRGKDAKVHEDVEILRGIGRLTEVQHNLDQLVQESRMPEKERRRRHEERRVKDSMRRLAAWMRRGNRQPPLA